MNLLAKDWLIIWTKMWSEVILEHFYNFFIWIICLKEKQMALVFETLFFSYRLRKWIKTISNDFLIDKWQNQLWQNKRTELIKIKNYISRKVIYYLKGEWSYHVLCVHIEWLKNFLILYSIDNGIAKIILNAWIKFKLNFGGFVTFGSTFKASMNFIK